MKGRIDVVLRGPRDIEAYRGALERALAETDRVLQVFNALVAVAQAESGVSVDQMAPAEIGALARDVAELYEPLAEEAGVGLALEAPAPIWARAHRQLLAQAMSNLVDNAIKYTPKGGQVTITIFRQDGRVTIAVADSGPGIPENERARALERFVRLGAGATPGYGLGLSLVAAVARLHGTELSLTDGAPGLRASFSLPEVVMPVAMAAQ
jgi:signal transduction histidine kinase